MQTDEIKDMVRGDRALGDGDIDRLGFREVATRISTALVNHGLQGSLVVGLEGRWGSGKSSLLNLIQAELDTIRPSRPHSLVHFRPWLVGNRDALLGTLFAELSTAIGRIEGERGDATRETVAKAQRAMEAARAFAVGLGRAGELVEVAGDWSGFKSLSWSGKGLKAIGAAATKREEKSLPILKKKLTKALDDLGHRIIITIDDLDRLDPVEVVEVLRLVRSVADFPNVVYLLCYDSEILARSIRRAAKVGDGYAYLEKIVQLTIPVPQPEAFQLRHWFAEALRDFAEVSDESVLERLRSVIDFEGGRQLTTPRAVNRTLDSLRLLWPTLRAEGADLGDLVWLQLIKDGNPRLYRWIEDYCAVAAELALGTARVEDQERSVRLKELQTITDADHFRSIHYRHAFAEQLPGVEESYDDDGPPFQLFSEVSTAERDSAIAARRLASPDHYRLYFALADPSHALKKGDFDAFWTVAAEGSAPVGVIMLQFHKTETSRTLGKLDILLERIRGGNPDRISSEQAGNILIAFSNILDEAWRIRSFDRLWVTSLWDRATKLMPILLQRLDAIERNGVLTRMFEQGAALGWLTTLYRRETFAHGLFGSSKKLESEWLLNAEELNATSMQMRTRYRTMSLDVILGEIDPRDILYAWAQGGGEAELHSLVTAYVKDDAAFLCLLDVLEGTIGTSEGRFQVMKRATVEPVIDFDEARARVVALAESANDPAIREKAQRLRTSFEWGDRY